MNNDDEDKWTANDVGSIAAEKIGEMLSVNTTLKTLNLSCNKE